MPPRTISSTREQLISGQERLAATDSRAVLYGRQERIRRRGRGVNVMVMCSAQLATAGRPIRSTLSGFPAGSSLASTDDAVTRMCQNARPTRWFRWCQSRIGCLLGPRDEDSPREHDVGDGSVAQQPVPELCRCFRAVPYGPMGDVGAPQWVGAPAFLDWDGRENWRARGVATSGAGVSGARAARGARGVAPGGAGVSGAHAARGARGVAPGGAGVSGARAGGDRIDRGSAIAGRACGGCASADRGRDDG